MSIEVRRVRDDELSDYVDALGGAFLARPDIVRGTEEARAFWDLDRVWGAFDDGRVCGTFQSRATELTVPGGARLPAAAVAAVTVQPTHRRRGILRSMATAAHAAMRDLGEAIALLYASEYPIYGRFGYGPGCRVATWTLDVMVTGFHGSAEGRIEHVSPASDGREAITAVFEQWRARQAGEIRRRDVSWEYDLGRQAAWGDPWKGFLVLHRNDAGDVDGYARYRAEEKWEHRQPRNILRVDELHALTDPAGAALWRFLAETDLVATVIAEGRSPDDRLPWLLTNARAARISDAGDGMWVRLFDVPRALEARTYERPGSLVIEAIDDEAPDGRVRVHLDASPDGAACRPTDRAPDLTVHVSALGAAYLGGTRLRDAVLSRGMDEHRPGALAEADALLRTLDEPWCSTFF
jgi:predicted acetyltransferase